MKTARCVPAVLALWAGLLVCPGVMAQPVEGPGASAEEARARAEKLAELGIKAPSQVEQKRERVNGVYRQVRGPGDPPEPSRVVYGSDNRIEVWAETDPNLRAMADAACVVVFRSELTNNGNGTYTLDTSAWNTQSGLPVCADEPFRGQPQIGFCSGFLVGTDIIATAGHCVDSGDVSSVAFVFGFEIATQGGSAPAVVSADDVYFPTQVLSWALSGGLDHSVVRLDRPVVGRSPVPIRRSGLVANGEPLALVGHPVVLPKKIAGGAVVKANNGSTGFFDANLDAYGGNSGSMVVNLNTYTVEGILVRGNQDFTSSGGCTRSNMLSDNNGDYEECSKTISFAGVVPELGLAVTPGGATTHIGMVGGPFSPASVAYTISNPTNDPLGYGVELTDGTVGVLINGGTSPLSGTVPAGGSVMVTASLDSSVASLPAGVYTETIEFTDVSNARTVTRTHTIEVGQTLVTVTPGTGLAGSGPVGGPFPQTAAYTVTSERPTPVNVQVSASAPWITLDGSSGPVVLSLNGVGDFDAVNVGIGGSAAALAAGLYNGQVTFTNLASGASVSRPVTLDVGRYVYPATGMPIQISDNSTSTSTITVPDGYCIGDVDVDLDIAHTYRGDLIVTLRSPEGTVVTLHNREGGSEDNLVGRYDDEGSLQPSGPGALADFDGETANGQWLLSVSDNAGQDTGAINGWSLRIASAGAVCPPVARDVQTPATANGLTPIALDGFSRIGAPTDFVIASLPSHGVLWDPAGGSILSTPHTLAAGGSTVLYRADLGYSGPDVFTYLVNDGQPSAQATVDVTVGGSQVVYSFPMDTNPGWTTEGSWAFGQPTGGGSHNFDPTSGYTGSNVYGYNLAGDYTNNMPARYLRTNALNCAGLTDVSLRFRRWLGVESSTFDQANVQVSANGTTWTTVWQHSGSAISESSWSLQTLNLSSVADNQPTVYIRWGIGPTDGSVTYPGWNIDDVEIVATVPAGCAADVSGNGSLGTEDFTTFRNLYLSGHPLADFNGDGQFSSADFTAFRAAYLGGC